MTQLTVNSNTYSDDGTTGRDMLNGGHATYFFPLIQDCLTDFAASEAAVAAYADALVATSESSVAIGTGTKTFTTQAGKQFAAGQWVVAVDDADADNWMFGTVASYSGTTLELSVSEVNGSGTISAWTISLAGKPGADGADGAATSLTPMTVTGADTLDATDKGKVVTCSGTFTLAFDDCATLGAGWWCRVRNSGSGVVTLDPDASETLDGVASFAMYPGEARVVYTDGTSLYSVIEQPFHTTLGSPGATLTIPPGYARAWCYLLGAGAGGGSGGRGGTTINGGRGGGGGAAMAVEFDVATGTTLEVTVGAGGAGAAGRTDNGTATNGADGGASTLGVDGGDAVVTATGGTASGTSDVTATVNAVAAGLPFAALTIPLYESSNYYKGQESENYDADGSGSICGGAAGGGGGGITGGTTVSDGGDGGIRGSNTTGGGGTGATTNGAAGGTADYAGGGGGKGHTDGNGGAGGDGAPGCGGGGGGPTVTGTASGAGGDGGDGLAIIRGIVG